MTTKLNCAFCTVKACYAPPGDKPYPANCPMQNDADVLDGVRELYETDATLQALAAASARTEATDYPMASRLENVFDFARRIEATRLGVAFCVGLFEESRTLQEILLSRGFEVYSVCCKCGSIAKETVGLRDEEKLRPGGYESICNPVAQAKLFNSVPTHLNVAVGLCVGHDSLLFRYCDAPVTVLVAKDRVLGHNPAAALYNANTYYRRVWGDEG